MNLKNKVKKLVEQLTDTHIYRVLPRGIDFIQDISNSLPIYRVDTVFDVGANVGQSSKVYLARFPSSHIYCFEPVGDTFRQLQDNLKDNERVNCYQLALGSSKSKGIMIIQGRSIMSFLLGQSIKSPINNDVTTESVDIITLDEFCHTKRIDQINYLKIDTEGGDLEVLKGSLNMLTEQRIDLVEVEAGMNPSNNRHVPFEILKGFLEAHRYFIFGIYEQVNEWPTREPHLRRTNILFISHRMIEMNRNTTAVSA
ncbi:MAG: FkbM family methyltransferase [Anaerolineae bacterium]|nr:FkbM family methyltransferase [Anaerolineae bacterium]